MAITVSTSPQNITASVGETQIDVTVSGGIGPSGTAGASNWNDITGKPSTFTPSSHTHDYVDVAGGSTFTNFLTTAGNLSVALSDIDSELSARALASDFDQGVKTTDSPTFNGLTVLAPYSLNSGGFLCYDQAGAYNIVVDAFGDFPGGTGAQIAVAGDAGTLKINSDGIRFADSSTQTTAWEGSVDWADVTSKPTLFDGAYTSLTSVPSSFTPSAHKTSHATGGSDALSPSDIGAATALHTHSATADITAGNWKVLYSNGSGAIVELALGASGTVLTSNGTANAPTFQAVQGESFHPFLLAGM